MHQFKGDLTKVRDQVNTGISRPLENVSSDFLTRAESNLEQKDKLE